MSACYLFLFSWSIHSANRDTAKISVSAHPNAVMASAARMSLDDSLNGSQTGCPSSADLRLHPRMNVHAMVHRSVHTSSLVVAARAAMDAARMTALSASAKYGCVSGGEMETGKYLMAYAPSLHVSVVFYRSCMRCCFKRSFTRAPTRRSRRCWVQQHSGQIGRRWR